MSEETATKKNKEEAKIDALNLGEASTSVHLFTRGCTILGYSVFTCCCSAVVMKLVSLVNFADSTYDNGLPKVNLYTLSFFVFFPIFFFALIQTYFNNALHNVIGKGLKRLVPSFLMFYFFHLSSYVIVFVILFTIFVYASNNLGLDQLTFDILLYIIGAIILSTFIALLVRHFDKKLKPFVKDEVLKVEIPVMEKPKQVGACKQVMNGLGRFIEVISVTFLAFFYIPISIVLYRLSGSVMKVVIALFIHPLIVELLMTITKFGLGNIKNIENKVHPFYDNFITFAIECIFNLFRRFLFNDTNNLNITFLLVVLSGFQEVLIRSTMEWKEVTMRRLMGSPPMSDDIKVLKRKYYSYTVTARSILELICIMLSPMLFAFFFHNRYAIDLGYNEIQSMDYDAMISSTSLQLLVELMVIYCCSLIEVKNGIPMSDFFHQFRDFRVFGSHISGVLIASFWILYNFKTVPNRLVCSDSNNPCSCTSFSLYSQLCGNLTTVNSTVKVDISSANLNDAFLSNGNLNIALLSILGIICICAVTFYLVKKRDIENFEKKVELRQQSMIKTVLDVATVNLMEQSALQQAIITIESLCRGVSPSQSRLLQGVIETLKSQAKFSNVIDIDGVFVNNNDVTTIWLKEQLSTHEQYKFTGKKKSSHTNKFMSQNDIPINQKRISARLRPSVVGLNTSSVHIMHDLSFRLPNDGSLPPVLQSSTNDDNLDVTSWDFNVFAIENKNAQSWLAWKCFLTIEIFEELKIPKLQLSNMLIFVEQNYSLVNYDSYAAYGEAFSSSCSLPYDSPSNDLKEFNSKSNPSLGNRYHNNLHGADVFQGVLYLATKYDDLCSHFGQFDLFGVLFAAYIHDFNHPGLNTTYMNADWPSSGISASFGTESPLEKHHLAMAFNLMRNTDQYNFLINCSPDKLDYFRKIVTACVMATDLAKSMPWISSAKIAFKDWRNEISNPIRETNLNKVDIDTKKEMEHRILLMQLSIKCADVGHPCRSLDQHLEWSNRIRDEFYSQGDKERSKGMEISPFCDRNVSLSNYPQGQIGFINFVSKPCFMLLNEVCWSVRNEDEKPWLKYMNLNIQYWEDKKKEASQITTIL